MKEELILEDAFVHTRMIYVDGGDAETCREEAAKLDREADDLRQELRLLEDRIERLSDKAERIEASEKLLRERISPFVKRALRRERVLIWPELEKLRGALEGVIDCGALVRIGLVLELPIPFELLPRMERRVAA